MRRLTSRNEIKTQCDWCGKERKGAAIPKGWRRFRVTHPEPKKFGDGNQQETVDFCSPEHQAWSQELHPYSTYLEIPT